MAAIGIRVYGKVQGVFFRATAKSVAEDLGLSGWVKNEPDGTVLMHAEGEQEKLEELEKWCHQGPEFSKVSKVESWEEDTAEMTSFEIRRS